MTSICVFHALRFESRHSVDAWIFDSVRALMPLTTHEKAGGEDP